MIEQRVVKQDETLTHVHDGDGIIPQNVTQINLWNYFMVEIRR